MTAFVQFNHHLVVLPNFQLSYARSSLTELELVVKLPFELQLLLTIPLIQTTTHQPITIHPAQRDVTLLIKRNELLSNLFLSRFLWKMTIPPSKLQGFPMRFEVQIQPNCLFESCNKHMKNKIVLFNPVKIC